VWSPEALSRSCRKGKGIGSVAVVYRGILGYGANRRIHKEAKLTLSHDRPILLSVVDTEEKLKAFMPILDQIVQQGLVVLSSVDVVKYSHNYQKAARRQETRI
jgi:PII-like signaling protein